MPTTDQTLRPATSLLVVDDDPDMLRLLSMRLTAAGYRVMAVASAESALNQRISVAAASERLRPVV